MATGFDASFTCQVGMLWRLKVGILSNACCLCSIATNLPAFNYMNKVENNIIMPTPIRYRKVLTRIS